MSTETSTQSDELVYVCPHCSMQIEVKESELGELVDCPNPDCGNPFQVPPPEAKLSQKSADQFAPGELLESQGAAQDETDLIVVHPAMFRNHPFSFLGLVSLFLLGVAGVVWGTNVGSNLLIGFSVLTVLAALGWFGTWWLDVYLKSLTITNKRTIYRHGIIRRQINEVQHDDVRNIQVHQHILEQLLGVGRIAISSSGQDDMEIDVRGIPDPAGLASTVRKYQ